MCPVQYWLLYNWQLYWHLYSCTMAGFCMVWGIYHWSHKPIVTSVLQKRCKSLLLIGFCNLFPSHEIAVLYLNWSRSDLHCQHWQNLSRGLACYDMYTWYIDCLHLGWILPGTWGIHVYIFLWYDHGLGILGNDEQLKMTVIFLSIVFRRFIWISFLWWVNYDTS